LKNSPGKKPLPAVQEPWLSSGLLKTPKSKEKLLKMERGT
jgi:hypothetical protein